MNQIFTIEYIIKNKGEKLLIIGTSTTKIPDYKPGENLRLDDVEVERAMVPRTEPRRFDLFAFRPKSDSGADQLKVGQAVTFTV